MCNEFAPKQFQYFILNKMQGLTQAGLGHINQSGEVYVYCILGTQVQPCRSLLEVRRGGQQMCYDFVEDLIRFFDISASIGHHQEAVDETRVCVNSA